jgi:hypothetical protein
MSLVDDFLLVGNNEADALFGTLTMAVDGQSFPVVWDDVSHTYEGALGGYENDIQTIAIAQPSHVANPILLLKKRCTIGANAYRISKVRIGTVAVSFELTSINNSK